MQVGGSASAAAEAARRAAEAARRAAEAAARRAAEAAARHRSAEQSQHKTTDAARQARSQAAETAKKTQEQSLKAREAARQAHSAGQAATQAQQAAKDARGPEASKLRDRAQEATKKAAQAKAHAHKEIEALKTMAAEGQRQAQQAQKLTSAANDAAVKAGEKPPFNDAEGFNALKDTFEDASKVKSAADLQTKLGAPGTADTKELTRAAQGDFVSDARIDAAAARVRVSNPAHGRDSDDSRVAASKQLKSELSQLPPLARSRLLEKLAPTVEEIAKGANGTPDEDDRKDILRNLADSATLSGPKGAQLVADRFTQVAVDSHTDVDNGDQLGGALKDVVNEDPRRAAFGFMLGKSMQAKGGLEDASKNVMQGTYEAVNHLDPSKFDRIAGDVKDKIEDVAKTVLKGFADAFDFVTRPITHALNEQIDKLGNGDSYKVGLGAHAQLEAVNASANANLEVKRGEDGKYTVSLSGGLNADLGKKLKIPGLEVGVDGKVECSFDNAAQAKRGADTIAQIAGSAVVGGATGIPGGALIAGGAATVANLGDHDAQFVAQHVSAVELGAKASADLSEKLGLPGMKEGTGVSASAEVGERARIEFGRDGSPPSVTFTQQGKVEGKAALAGGVPGNKVSLEGGASAQVTLQNKLTLPKGFGLEDIGSLGDVARGSKVESSVQVQLQQQAKVNSEVGPFTRGAEGSVTSTLDFKGDPKTILSKGLPDVLHGRFKDAARAVGDHVDVNASVELNLKGQVGANANLGPAYNSANGELAARLKLSGNPVDLAKNGIPKLFAADLPGAVKAVGDHVKVEADLKQSRTTGSKIEVGDPLGLFGADFQTQRVDVGDKPLWSYGVDDPNTRANETRTASQAATELSRQWNRLQGRV